MTPSVSVPRLLISGTSSGVGKTTVTAGLARAMRRRGLEVAMFKCGPDFLDPTYHEAATGKRGHTLDGWMMGREGVREAFVDGARGADIALVEGMMGLFDGAAGGSNEGSSAEIAGWLDAGIVLVVDASAMARSVGALVHGFDTFDREVRVSGVIANRLGGRGHLELVKSAVERIPVWGGIPLDADAAFAERHLGLVAADQDGLLASRLERCADLIEEWLDIDALVHAASSATSRVESTSSRVVSAPTGRCRIGIARDAAFSFYYDDNLRRLVECGATLVDCSPMRDAALPDVDGLYLGGGYPEIHAAALEANASFRASVRRFAEAGAPIYAECGGLMYLSRGIRTLGGQRHEMVGLLPAETTMKDRLAAIGYVEATVAADGILGPAGTRLRGHQFRYSELTAVDAHDPAYTLTSPWNAKETREGFHAGNVVASYVHAHFASNPDAPRRFVNACARHSSPSL